MKIKIKKIIFFIVILTFVIICCTENNSLLESGSDENINIDPNYPLTLSPLSNDSLNQLQTEFDSLNNNQLCSNLNKYGFLEDGKWCRPSDTISIDETSALWIAKQVVLRNKKFTNVVDSNSLNSCEQFAHTLDGIKWIVRFEQQKLDTLTILGSFVWVLIKGGQPYSIDRHWYKDIYIPPIDQITKEMAKDRIVGEKINWYDVAGILQELIVTEDIVSNNIEKVIYPQRKDELIMMRVIWKIPITSWGFSIGWYAYVDTSTGELLSFNQQFIT